jgi:uncharacterized protein
MSSRRRLRHRAVTHSLGAPAALRQVIERLGFVQADPIRSPARAQDLILRHRVGGYRAGDLERDYPSLGIEEDLLYAYGFVPRRTWRLLHPRAPLALTALERAVLRKVRALGEVHPRQLEPHFGTTRVINPWGGQSKATTRALDHLHYRGLLRIARRDSGIRVYQALPRSAQELLPVERANRLALLVADILAPAPRKSLQSVLSRMLRALPGKAANARVVLDGLIRSGALECHSVDGLDYLHAPATEANEAPRQVRLLAPFDPIVWDRLRFEHLWGWSYRFEAYTPVAKRQRGYYALPLLWGDDIIGWANARMLEGRLDVELGFVNARPRDLAFRRELELELARFEGFLR